MDRLAMRNDVLGNSLASGMGNMIQTANATTTTPSVPKSGNTAPEAAENGTGNRFDRFEKTGKAASAGKNGSATDSECKTCAERKYQDGSDDGGVSFQSPTKVSPQAAGAAVRSHEQEHVTRNAAKAKSEGKIANSHVAIHTAVCPECGKTYVSGGTTTTTYTDDPTKDENGKPVDKVGGADSIGSSFGGGTKTENIGSRGFTPVGDPGLLRKFGAGTSRYAA